VSIPLESTTCPVDSKSAPSEKLFKGSNPIYQPVMVQSFSGGAGGIRTHVQTYSPKAFYMLILELIVEKLQEPNKPTVSVAE